MAVEIEDIIFIYDEADDRIKSFEVVKDNKDTYRVEKNWGKQFNAFTVRKDEENITWFNSYASCLSHILDEQYKNIKKLKRNIEAQLKRLDEIKRKHSRHKVVPKPTSDEESNN